MGCNFYGLCVDGSSFFLGGVFMKIDYGDLAKNFFLFVLLVGMMYLSWTRPYDLIDLLEARNDSLYKEQRALKDEIQVLRAKLRIATEKNTE